MSMSTLTVDELVYNVSISVLVFLVLLPIRGTLDDIGSLLLFALGKVLTLGGDLNVKWRKARPIPIKFDYIHTLSKASAEERNLVTFESIRTKNVNRFWNFIYVPVRLTRQLTRLKDELGAKTLLTFKHKEEGCNRSIAYLLFSKKESSLLVSTCVIPRDDVKLVVSEFRNRTYETWEDLDVQFHRGVRILNKAKVVWLSSNRAEVTGQTTGFPAEFLRSVVIDNDSLDESEYGHTIVYASSDHSLTFMNDVVNVIKWKLQTGMFLGKLYRSNLGDVTYMSTVYKLENKWSMSPTPVSYKIVGDKSLPDMIALGNQGIKFTNESGTLVFDGVTYTVKVYDSNALVVVLMSRFIDMFGLWKEKEGQARCVTVKLSSVLKGVRIESPEAIATIILVLQNISEFEENISIVGKYSFWVPKHKNLGNLSDTAVRLLLDLKYRKKLESAYKLDIDCPLKIPVYYKQETTVAGGLFFPSILASEGTESSFVKEGDWETEVTNWQTSVAFVGSDKIGKILHQEYVQLEV
mmetsp:Transcript_14956/g.18135  ORF Transcript_14956/g.18135 Transcript_14956/m.18135 type:complete len:522 (+) Transcript_14956:349-1914(+)|eukprot:CAMPEP_0184042010 /NCGR_PEP_ID=MMETSP0955-20130417/65156_1 /TAXON_ID=627963 /ORGANISM="Aplanochytrium sp, Strain PBS07" /LENGTH=521 /DNA_ID=CAMNT_0026332625 /DNA_START=325 /DNA_END=1890 /DNA_ORIENTATION=-